MLVEARVNDHRSFEPNFSATGSARRAGAVAVTTGMHGGERFENERAAEIQLRESGTLVLGSRCPVIDVVRGDNDEERIFEVLIVEHTELLVELSGVISRRFGFAGSWRFGLVVTGLRGKNSHATMTNVFRHSEPYSDDDYIGSASATLEEITFTPMRVVEDLVGSLLRSLNSLDYSPSWTAGRPAPWH